MFFDIPLSFVYNVLIWRRGHSLQNTPKSADSYILQVKEMNNYDRKRIAEA